jgi:Flp pilus assembly protein TadB
MKQLLILLFMVPLMAQSINDTDEAKQEHRQSVIEQEQMRQEKFNKQKQLRREQQVNEMMLRMKKQDKKRKHIIKKKIRKQRIRTFILGLGIGYAIGDNK